MAKNGGVPVHVNLDIEDAVRTAESLSKKISEAINKNKGTSDPRIAKTIQDLERLQAKYTAISSTMQSNSANYTTMQSRVQQLAEAFKKADTELKNYEQDVASTGKGYAKLIENLRSYGYEEEKVRKLYFGRNKIEEGSAYDEQIKAIVELRGAWEEAYHALQVYSGFLANMENPMDNTDGQAYAKALQDVSDKAEITLLRMNELDKRTAKTGNTFRSSFYFARTILNDLNRSFDKISAKLKQFGSHVLNSLKHLVRMRKEANKTTNSLSDGFKHALRNIMRYGLGVRSLYFLFRRLRTYAKEALDVLAQTFPAVNEQMSRATTALNQMKGAIGTMIQPLLNVLVPVLERVAALISKIMSLIGGVFALLTGQNTIYSAVATQNDYAASLDKTGGAAKKAKKELEGYLSPIDEINKFQSKKDDSGGGAGGAGFEYAEQPVSDLAKRIKDIIDSILAPIKKAWAKVGDFVKQAWTKAFKSVKDLAVDIGKDFIEVWNQPETVAMLEDILRIFGGIGTIIDAIAVKLDIAWRTNETGKKILEAIRDIFAIVIGHIKDAIQYTENWAMQLNFVPLLTAFKDWLESMKPVVDAIAGVFEDFYKKVLLPLGEWAIEEGLPQLIQVFIDFNEKVDWEALRSRLAEFWEHLEPFTERVGEGLIAFIGDLSDKLAEFIDSGKFEDLLTKIEDWMDSVTAEDVENTFGTLARILPTLAVGFLALKTALSGLSSLMPVVGMIGKLSEAFGGGATAGGAAAGATGASGLAGSVAAADAEFEALSASLGGVYSEAELAELGVSGVSKSAGAVAAPFAAAAAAIAVVIAAFKHLWDTSESFRASITAIMHDLGSAFKDFFGDSGSELKEFASAMKTGFREIVDFVKPVWENFCKFLSPVFTNAFKMVSNTLKDTLQVMKGALQIFTGIFTGNWQKVWDGVVNIFKGSFNVISDTFEGVLNNIIIHVNGFIDKINSISSTGHALIPAIPKFDLPRLAQGAVLPANKPFMAMVGDQKQGTNIETPLDTMIEAFNTALAQNGGGGTTTINFVLPDRRKVAQYVLEGGKVIQTSTGSNPFQLA